VPSSPHHQDAKTRHLQLVASLQKRRQGVGEQIANPAIFIMVPVRYFLLVAFQEVPFDDKLI
jgi:hypothetical protein